MAIVSEDSSEQVRAGRTEFQLTWWRLSIAHLELADALHVQLQLEGSLRSTTLSLPLAEFVQIRG